MATSLMSVAARRCITLSRRSSPAVVTRQCRRQRSSLSTRPEVRKSTVPDFAFAFDIDGVLVRSSTPIEGAQEALSYLQQERIPFILLTNGGGKSEQERVANLSKRLGVNLDTSTFIQSHTPFADFEHHKDGTVLVVGGDYDKCQRVATEHYGFAHAVTPGDIFTAYPDIWPFSRVFLPYYQPFAKPLPRPLTADSPAESLKIDAIHVYNDPRDWGLDATIILDLLLSQLGILGTLSPKNNTPSLPNNGYLQDSQPHIYFSNPDVWWASSYQIPRLGQGGFRHAFTGLWNATTNHTATLDSHMTVMGKPHQPTYEFAEKKLRQHRRDLYGSTGLNDPLRRVYMIGDNPESDIRGASNYKSPHGSTWKSVLVQTGVYKQGTEPSCVPDVTVANVKEAVQWALKDSEHQSQLD